MNICIVPVNINSIGGPSSFVQKISKGLHDKKIAVKYNLDDFPYNALLIINGTREFHQLVRIKKKGIRIVQRLGVSNLARCYLSSGLRDFFIAKARNIIMQSIKFYFADHIVYQSKFARNWWNEKSGKEKVPSSVIYNGVDLNLFNPKGPKYDSIADICIISVEGTQGVDPYNIAIQLAQGLERKGLSVELLMLGNLRKNFNLYFSKHSFVKYMGVIPNSQLPYYYRGATFYIFTDIISAACPNSVIEALACGTPILGYNVGVLPEMLNGYGGKCVECYGNPYHGESPGNLEGLISAAIDIFNNWEHFHRTARELAEERFDVTKMVDEYLNVLLGSRI
ncbi:MAG: glycosyltransferase family 4 protein [candidate division WOR-3 bacterium]